VPHRRRRVERSLLKSERTGKGTPEDRTFTYLNSRIHTRESSTLMFSTVAASASLVLLGI